MSDAITVTALVILAILAYHHMLGPRREPKADRLADLSRPAKGDLATGPVSFIVHPCGCTDTYAFQYRQRCAADAAQHERRRWEADMERKMRHQ